MKKAKLTGFYFSLMIIFFCLFGSTAQAKAFTSKPLKIVSISNLDFTIYKGNDFVLPNKVKALMDNNKMVDLPVTWLGGVINTNKIGSYNFYGQVKDYIKKVNLKLTVKALPATISSINDLTASIKHNSKFTLPKTISATMSDGVTKNVSVEWNSNQVDTSKDGEFSYRGKVKGYSYKVEYQVFVMPVISYIKDLNINLNQNDKFELPSSIVVHMSDDSEPDMPITWDSPEVNTKRLGTYTYNGMVEGYNKKVILTLVVDKLTIQDIAKESKKVFLLNIYNSKNELEAAGSGFAITNDGELVTNYHVIDGADHVVAVDSNNKSYDIVSVMGYSKVRDIAILKIDSATEPVKIGDSYNIELGQEVVAIGSPLGLQNTVSNGIVSSIRNSNRDIDTTDIQISVPISHGSSGGALFNMSGEVIGITYASIESGENLNFAIPINEIYSIGQDTQSRGLTFKEVYENEHIITYTNGKYEGDIVNGKRQGHGFMKWNNGDTYIGDWNNEIQNGKGTYTWANGDKYTGDWVDGEITGIGTYKWENGDKYEGSFKLGKKTGYGIYTWPNGNIYEGLWSNGNRNGYGIFTNTDGTNSSGIWVDDNFVGSPVASVSGISYFRDLSDVPVPIGYSFSKTTASDDEKAVFYWYTDINISNYCNLLIQSGFTYLKNLTGEPIMFFQRNGNVIGIYVEGGCWVIGGKIH